MRIKSVSEEQSPVKPYGQGCRDVLDKALELGAALGFDTRNYEYYCGKPSQKILGGTGDFVTIRTKNLHRLDIIRA